jgi:chitinase
VSAEPDHNSAGSAAGALAGGRRPAGLPAGGLTARRRAFAMLALIVVACALTACSALPSGSLIVGYATACDSAESQKVIEAATAGVNVVIWFQVDLAAGRQIKHSDSIQMDCISQTVTHLQSLQLETTHLISVGGWNAPHPDTEAGTGAEWAAEWITWNSHIATKHGFAGFEGIDWDIEGNDNVTDPANTFTPDCLSLIGDMSVSLKSKGFVVSMAPPESYLDVSTPLFDRSLQHAYSDGWKPGFKYHGHNAYALLIAKYGVSTFDFISVQLYESWSHADYFTTQEGVPVADYLESWVTALATGWHVDFSSDPQVDFNSTLVAVPPSKLVVGLSQGCCFEGGTPPGKSVWIPPQGFKAAYLALPPHLRPRGGMFWNVELDGAVPSNGSAVNVSLAKGLNSILHVRQSN